MFDPRRPTLRYRIDRGDCLGVVWLALGSVALVEIAGARRSRTRSCSTSSTACGSAGTWRPRSARRRPDVPVMVRVAENSPTAIGEALDAGAEGRDRAAGGDGEGGPEGRARRPLPAARHALRRRRAAARTISRPMSRRRERGIVVILMIETARGVQQRAGDRGGRGRRYGVHRHRRPRAVARHLPARRRRHEAACARHPRRLPPRLDALRHLHDGPGGRRAARAQGYRMVVTTNDIDMAAKRFRQATAAFAALKTRRASAPNGAAETRPVRSRTAAARGAGPRRQLPEGGSPPARRPEAAS